MPNNYIDSIRLSGTTYQIQGSGGGGTQAIELTQAQYDALVDKDPNVFYIITDAEAGDLTNYYTKTETDNAITAATSTKQDTLQSGTNIKTINNESILGSGNIDIQGGGGMTEDDELLLSTALTDLNDRKIDASEVKSQLGNYQKKGDYVTTNTLNARLAEYETALDEQNVEEVTAYALNDLNNRFGGLKIVKISESEYAALTTKDENTLYIVVADPS